MNMTSQQASAEVAKHKRSSPIPCLGLGLSVAGFVEGKVMGTSITAYFTLEPPPSVPFSDNKNREHSLENLNKYLGTSSKIKGITTCQFAMGPFVYSVIGGQ